MDRIDRVSRFAEKTFVVFNNDAAGKSFVNSLQLKEMMGSRRTPAPLDLRANIQSSWNGLDLCKHNRVSLTLRKRFGTPGQDSSLQFPAIKAEERYTTEPSLYFGYTVASPVNEGPRRNAQGRSHAGVKNLSRKLGS